MNAQHTPGPPRANFSYGDVADAAAMAKAAEANALALKVTKRREGDGKFGPRWRILIDGRPTPFTVEKSIPPKYRQPQQWDVIEGDDPDCVLFDSTSLDGALAVISTIARASQPIGGR